jgi:SWI/SNF-related matrix-associated actin-dependent regulator of chromatin subfamily A3
LADEMGMGKTLSILALISKTLDFAKTWAGDETDRSKEAQKIPSQATLVIVPSGLLIQNWIHEMKMSDSLFPLI